MKSNPHDKTQRPSPANFPPPNKLPLSAIYMTTHSRCSNNLRQIKQLSKNILKEKTSRTCPAPTANTPIRHVQVTVERKKSERNNIKETCSTFYPFAETAQTQLPLHSTSIYGSQQITRYTDSEFFCYTTAGIRLSSLYLL